MESRASADKEMLEVKCKAVIQITVSSHLKKAFFFSYAGGEKQTSPLWEQIRHCILLVSNIFRYLLNGLNLYGSFLYLSGT